MESNASVRLEKRRSEVRNIVKCGLFAAITSVLTLITIPLPSGVPITLQTFAIALCGYALGVRYGTVSTGVYIALGAVGLPVFSGMRGGISMITGATGGFIFGFLPFAALCGLGISLSRNGGMLKRGITAISLGIAGLIVCHLMGTAQFAFLTGRGFIEAAALASLPYLVKDIISVVLAYLLAVRLPLAVRKV